MGLATALNSRLKRSLPRVHSAARHAAWRWMHSERPLVPAIRRIGDEWVWVHPRVLTADMARTEPHIVRWMDGLLHAGDTFFDVGANCGWLSLHAAKRVGPRGVVVAFEPSPILVNLLDYHVRVNRAARIRIVPKAVCDSDAAGIPLFLIEEGFSTRNSLTIGGGAPFVAPERISAASVPATTLDAYCQSTGTWPTLVKIDVEGAELMVLRGAARVLERRPHLIAGTHPYWLPAGETVEQLFELLAGRGYAVLERHTTQFAGFEVGDYLLAPA